MTNALTNLPLSEAAVIADCGAPVADLPAEVRMTDRRLLRPDSPAQMLGSVFGRRVPPFVASLKVQGQVLLSRVVPTSSS
jgi:hypothetical protein